MAIDWTKRSEYIERKHGVTVAEASEALADPDRVLIVPDYNSRSGDSARIIGFSASFGTFGELLTVITYYNADDDTTYGVNAWKANARDRRYYQQGGMDDE